MEKVLFIMLERSSASGLCTVNVARELAARGVRVDMLSYSGQGPAPEGITVHEIRPKLWLDLAARKGRWAALWRGLYRLQVAAFTPVWPLNAPLFARKLYRRAAALMERERYDRVVGVYTQVDPLIALGRLKRKYPGLKTAAYFLDSLSAGPAPRLLSERQKVRRGLRWEKRLLENTDGVVFMRSSEAHHRRFSANMPHFSRAVFLDIPMLCRVEPVRREKRPEEPLTLTYVGSLPPRIRDPRYGVELLSRITGRRLKLRFVGPLPDSQRLQRECGALMDVEWVGPVPHDRVGDHLAQADVLLNFGNRVAGMVPSKIFEYISWGKPILCFSPDGTDPSIPYLERYPAGCVIREDADPAENLKKTAAFLESCPGEPPDPAVLRRTFAANTPGCFCDWLESL